ncbi:MAG: flavin reductase family protein [Butyrivibrio sp.]|nr:flavin reductase family protein [Butyrivibrio sp.]
MHTFQPLDYEMLEGGPLKFDDNSWMLITAADGDKANAMTASWGGVGRIWDKLCVFIFVRESRYTKELLDASDEFSINFMDDKKHHGLKNYMGKVSGRNEDKIAGARLNVGYDQGIPYLDEAMTVILARVAFKQPFEEQSFISQEIIDKYYSNGDYHTIYIAEIEKIMAR